MIFDWLGMAFVGAALAGCAVLYLVVFGLAWLMWSHFNGEVAALKSLCPPTGAAVRLGAILGAWERY